MISAELRRSIHTHAEGRCEYCRMPDEDGFAPHEIDHIYAEKHGGATVDANLCLACWICNRHKGTDLASLDPLTGEITRLFHPRTDIWSEHFNLNGAALIPITPQGRVTVRLLQLNRQDRLAERRLLIEMDLYP